MRKVLLMIALLGCGGDEDSTPDAAPGRPVLALNCTTYCDTIAAACTGANAQYSDAAHCTGTCAAFPPGQNASETSGNTLGCRIYHAQNAMLGQDPTVHCPHAGPGGGKVDAAAGQCGDPCLSFCTLNTKVCGTNAAPVTGVANRYADMAACMTACNGFEKTTQYSPSVNTGNNLACRINHLTNAASSTMANVINTHCGHTLSPATGVCLTAP